MTVRKQITGIILAGGKSSRMGLEKGLVEYNNKPLIEYAVDLLTPFCDEILISANTNSYDYLGFPVLTDIHPGIGPMAGIYTCLLHSKHDFNFVLSCDMPLMKSDLIARLIKRSAGCDITVPTLGNGHFEPLCAVYHKKIIPVLEKLISEGNFKVRSLFEEIAVCKEETGPGNKLDPRWFFNVNTKKQLAELESQLPGKTVNGTSNGPDELQPMPNLLMIAGTGRNTGKTTLACEVIRKISKQETVTGIKISPHLHRQAKGQKIIARTDDFLILQETDSGTGKDSSRMLRAGASPVYYLQTKDAHLKSAFEILSKLIGKSRPVVCESGALLRSVKPGLFLLTASKGTSIPKKEPARYPYQPDLQMTFDGNSFQPGTGSIAYGNGKWYLKPNAG